jgi:hypothetical protein
MTASDEPAVLDTGEPGEPPRGGSTEAQSRRAAAVGRITVALVITWTALIAIPGAVPWSAADDTARAIAIGIGISTIVSIVGLALAWLRLDDLGIEGATFGTAAALAGLALVALEVMYLMLLPDDAAYRETAVGIGLLVLIAIGLLVVTALRTSLFEGLRLTNGTILGGVVAVAVVVVYFLMIQTMLSAAPNVEDDEWTRMNTLLTGVQTIAFAALGALLGTAVQGQVTASAKEGLANAETANDDLAAATEGVKEKLDSLTGGPAESLDMVLLDALNEDPQLSVTAKRRWIQTHRPLDTGALSELSGELDRALERNRMLRRRR